MNQLLRFYTCVYLLLLCACTSTKPVLENAGSLTIVPVDSAWASNSVNTTVFRKNSLTSYNGTQFTAFYNKNGFVVLGKRKMGESHWILKQTPYQGNIYDAHNIISIMVDGEGFLHVAWDHHNTPLKYARSLSPGSLDLTAPMPMTGEREAKVSYPEFYKLSDGNLLFFYRDGGSGNGNLIINKYDVKNKQWATLQTNLIDGERKRNAYWQAFVDRLGYIHISWVWRESPDVASNHDLCYAISKDGGLTWQKSTGEKYELPINAGNAEYIFRIPQKSELINQTSMYADEKGSVFIATYWREANDSVPQYHVVCKYAGDWKVLNTGFRHTPFSLSGGGTKKIPIARPQIVAWYSNNKPVIALVYRDIERQNHVSMALNKDINSNKWQLMDLVKDDVGAWEPSFDTELWNTTAQLHLFVLKTVQVDGEGLTNVPPQIVHIVEWKP